MEVQDELQTRGVEPNFSIFHLITAVRVKWHQPVNIEDREQIHFIGISAIIYLTKELISHESADFPPETLNRCPDIKVPGGKMEIITPGC